MTENQLENIKKQIIGSCTKCSGLGYTVDRKNKTYAYCSCTKEFLIKKRIMEDIPQAYWDLDLPDFENKKDKAYINTVDYIQHLDNCRRDGVWVYFQGTSNTGKTLLAIAILKSAIRKSYSSKVYTVSGLVNGVSDEEFREDFTLRDFIVIDSIDLIFKGGDSNNKVSGILESMLREKSLNNTVCIFTSRYSLKKLESDGLLNDRVCELISSKTAPITIEGPGRKHLIR